MHFVMEQRMLRGIKERVEDEPLVPPLMQASAHVGWALAGAGLLAIFLSQRKWWLWLTPPLAVSLPAVLLTGDLNAMLAGFLAVGITVAGALAFGWRWWPGFLVIASAVAFVLLLTPDPYSAFGLLFLTIEVAFVIRFIAARPGALRTTRRNAYAPV